MYLLNNREPITDLYGTPDITIFTSIYQKISKKIKEYTLSQSKYFSFARRLTISKKKIEQSSKISAATKHKSI